MEEFKGTKDWRLFKGSPFEGNMNEGMTYEVHLNRSSDVGKAKANAKLISAAPELLKAALMLSKKQFDIDSSKRSVIRFTDSEINLFSDAIKKALGKQ